MFDITYRFLINNVDSLWVVLTIAVLVAPQQPYTSKEVESG